MVDKVESITFDDVYVSPSNQGKLNVAKILATEPNAFRLVVIDDLPSHQLFLIKHAIQNSWEKQQIPMASISISDFTDEVILSIKSRKPFNPDKFDAKNLIVDDLQCILDSPTCQGIFVRTILKRRLESRTKLTVLFCTYPLSEMVSMTDELRDFLKLGLKEGAIL